VHHVHAVQDEPDGSAPQPPSVAIIHHQALFPDDYQTQDDPHQTQAAARIPDLQDHHPFQSGTCASGASAGELQETFQAVSPVRPDHLRNCHPDRPGTQDEAAGI
jgi:hypothetical protein